MKPFFLECKVVLLRVACRRLAARRPAGRIGWWDVALLALAWGNLGYAAGPSYLRRVAQRALSADGPVLECGSGATTLLVAAITSGTARPVVALEHNRQWHGHVACMLDRLGFGHVRVLHAPLKAYAGFHWYEMSADFLPDDIDLVICDGPPGNTPGGRFGLMPVVGPRLARQCVILLDDTHRRSERRLIAFWRRYRCLQARRLGRFGRYAELVLC